MGRKKKKDLGFTAGMAKALGFSQRSIQRRLRVGEAMKAGVYSEELLKKFKIQKTSHSKMYDLLVDTKTGREMLSFRVFPEIKEIFEDFKRMEGFESNAEALRYILHTFLRAWMEENYGDESSPK